MEEKTNNINFFQQIYFATCKINKYGELLKYGIKKSIFYVMDLIVICSIIYSIIITIQMKKNVNALKTYLDGNFPDVIYQENKLISNLEEEVILNDNLVKINFGGQIVIDTNSNYEEIIEKYKNAGEPTILLANNKYVTINSKGKVSEYNYDEIIVDDEEENINLKEYLINSFDNISLGYYFIIYFIGPCIGTSILVFAYSLIMSGVAFIICKIKKIKAKFTKIYSITLYAQTLLILSYFIMNLLPTSIYIYAQAVAFCIPIIYLLSVIYNSKITLE